MTLLASELLSKAGFSCAFPTRDISDAEVLAGLGPLAGTRIVQVKQVHGARVVRAEQAEGQEADGIVGAQGAAVGVRVADCVPVLVADEASGAVAAIHAGWRGVVAGVVGAGVALLGGGGRGRTIAAIGPCIGPCCFEVGLEVADRTGFVVRRAGDRAYVDLRAAVRAQLLAAGVASVEDVAGCTRHEPDRFHSFRRDGAHSGRMLASIVSQRRH